MAEVPEEIQAELILMETTTRNELMEEAEQPLLTPEEVAANLAARDVEVTEKDMDAEVCGDRIVGWNSTERVEKSADVALETRGEENPTEKAEVGTDETPGDREVVIMTDEEEKTERVVPRDEAARAKAATVHIYQRRPAREEASGRKSIEEQPRETHRQRTERGVNSPARSVVVPPCRRRRLLIDEEPKEEDDVFFTPVDALPSSEPPAPPAEVEDNDRERRERKRKGKAVAAPVKKKPQ